MEEVGHGLPIVVPADSLSKQAAHVDLLNLGAARGFGGEGSGVEDDEAGEGWAGGDGLDGAGGEDRMDYQRLDAGSAIRGQDFSSLAESPTSVRHVVNNDGVATGNLSHQHHPRHFISHRPLYHKI